MANRKIIVAVLNWGLGHASRSIPVIRAAEEAGFEPVLASDGEALLLLRKEFPHLTWYELSSYNISYPRNGRNYKWHFLKKGPAIAIAIDREHRRLEELISGDPSIAGIVSDNRLGAFSKQVPSVYLTHQLRVFSGSTTFLSSRIHRHFINQFSQCWVPDLQETDNLSGALSHRSKIKIPVNYIGPLSRFTKREQAQKYELSVVLSGPEPQRSLFEQVLRKELDGYKGQVLLVRGKIGEKYHCETKGNIKVCNFLLGEALEVALNQSDLVLARSGYSTIMDLSALGKRAFFIPTPGQPEQEYLAKRLQEQNIAPFCRQEEFSLEKIEEAALYSGFPVRRSVPSLRGLFTLFEGK